MTTEDEELELGGEPLDEKSADGLSVKAKSIDEEARTLVATVSTDMVDRDEEIVAAPAFRKRLKSYKKNPVLLWMHNPFLTPIGKALDVAVGDKSIEATLYFRPDNELAEDVFQAYKQGVLTSFSIGFRTYRREKTAGADGMPGPSKIVDAELFEISAVTIPANTEATVKFARMAKLLESSLLGHKPAGATIYTVPTDLDVLKRCAQILQARIDANREGKSMAAEDRAAVDEIRRVVSALAAPSAATQSDDEVLRALRGAIDATRA